MKRAFSLILSVCMLAALLTGCGGKQTETPSAPAEAPAAQSSAAETPAPAAGAAANRLEEILARGYVTIATEPYFAPYEFIDPSKQGDEQYVGADVEFMKLIAEKLGVELKIVPLDLTTVQASVAEGKYDLAVSALAYTADRAENMNLSDSYFIPRDDDSGYGFVVRADLADTVKTVADLSDKVVAVQQGSLQQFLWETYGGPCKEVKYASSTNDVFLMVSEGKADAAVTAFSFANNYINANANCGLVLADYAFDVEDKYLGEVVAMKKGEDELLAKINEIIAEMAASEVFYEWYDQYSQYAASLGL